MKKMNSLKTLTCGLAAAVLVSFAGINSANAGVFIGVRIGGGGPPPPVVEHPWAPPYAGAVWIPGHHHWDGHRYVWYGGYYAYPPRPNAVWIPDHYVVHHGEYFFVQGHWRYQ